MSISHRLLVDHQQLILEETLCISHQIIARNLVELVPLVVNIHLPMAAVNELLALPRSSTTILESWMRVHS